MSDETVGGMYPWQWGIVVVAFGLILGLFHDVGVLNKRQHALEAKMRTDSLTAARADSVAHQDSL